MAAFLQCQAARSSVKAASNNLAPYVLDTCRTLFAWASDPERGNILGEGFRNPFRDRQGGATSVKTIPLGEPDITLQMAVQFLSQCDAFQLRLFATILLCGLRPSEITFLFAENTDAEWLHVRCLPEIDYYVKGRRNKQIPLVEPLRGLLNNPSSGLLFVRRDPPANVGTLARIVRELAPRDSASKDKSAAERLRRRDQVLLAHGCLNYDRIEGEFRVVAEALGWPRSATLKDFRHLFSTSLENAGVPEFYRRFLMAQSPGRSAIVGYTHLNRLKEYYSQALEREFSEIIATIEQRGTRSSFKT